VERLDFRLSAVNL